MAAKLTQLKPYKSFILCKVMDKFDSGSVLPPVLKDLEGVLDLAPDGRRRLISRGGPADTAGLQAGFIHYMEERPAAWTTDPAVTDRLNHLVLVCRRNRNVAIYLSDNRWRNAIYERLGGGEKLGLGALERIPSGILNAAFVTGPARTLWLSGAHRRTSVKADSKVLSGIELRDALDPLDDQTYYFTAARCATEIEHVTTPVGVAPRGSRVWAGLSRSWEDFRDSVNSLLAHLEATDTPEPAPLPVVAIESIEPATVEGAFDAAILPPELLSDDPTVDPDIREETEKWSYHSSFTVLETTGPNLLAEVRLKGSLLGTVEFTVDVSKSDHVTWEVDGKPASAVVADDHEGLLAACRKQGWVKIWYESGHTISGYSIFQIRHRDLPFTAFQWADLSRFDVTTEKPDPLDIQTIGRQKSLFCWVRNNWPVNGAGTRRQRGWLACDDGSMEIADFIHLDDTAGLPKQLTLIHVKGAGSDKPDRGISVSDYEVVTGQAIKNLRHLDRMALNEGLKDGLKRQIGKLVWHNGRPSKREEMIKAISGVGANYERHVVILQPRVKRASLDRARSRPASKEAARLRQLDTLLIAADASCHALGARLTVIGEE